MSSLQAWQDCLLARSKARSIASLAHREEESIRELWELFTKQRSELGRYLQHPKREAIAYTLAFHQTNFARMMGLLGRWEPSTEIDRFLAKRELNICDLGSGSAALTSAFVNWMEDRGTAENMRLTLVDRRQAFLEIAADILARQGYKARQAKCDIEAFSSNMRKYKPKDNEGLVYLVGYLWNELPPKVKRKFLEALAHISDSGREAIVIMLEPAHEESAISAQALRNTLVGEMGWQVHYPCPRSGPCPMTEGDRCYSEFAWQRNSAQKTIDAKLGVSHERLGASAYVFSTNLGEASTKAPVIVGKPTISRTAFRTLVCNGASIERGPGGAQKESGQLYRGNRAP